MHDESSDNKTEIYFFQLLMGKVSVKAGLLEVFEIVFQQSDASTKAPASDFKKPLFASMFGGFSTMLVGSYTVFKDLSNADRIAILEILFGPGVTTVSDFTKKIDRLHEDASGFWEESDQESGLIFEMIQEIVEKAFNIADEEHISYLMSQKKETDELEIIDTIKAVLREFEKVARKKLLERRSVFEKNFREHGFLSEEEIEDIFSDLQSLKDQMVSQVVVE